MYRFLTIISLVLVANYSHGQINDLDTIINKIIKINEVQTEHVGYAGVESENYKNFEQLKKIASIKELIHLTNNKNATVACYASWALADKSYPDLKTI